MTLPIALDAMGGDFAPEQIVKGARRRRLKNVSIKLDAAQVVALKRIATQKAMPYQTLIRSWLAEGLRRELIHQR